MRLKNYITCERVKKNCIKVTKSNILKKLYISELCIKKKKKNTV